jgi:serine/threonine protein kinase
MTCLDDEVVLRMLDGELAEPEWEAIEGHLDRCDRCRELVAAVLRPRTAGAVGPRTAGAVRRVVSDHGAGFAPLEEIPGRYLVEGVRGQGGQARVLLVFDQLLQREVALKELLSTPGAQPPEADGAESSRPPAGLEARFLREARTTGRLQHPTVVDVYEVGRRTDGTLYYTMPFLRGRTLAEALATCTRVSDRLALLPHFVDVCNGIAYAHSRGVLHRDLKPANIMLGEFGESVILDWGLAKPFSGPEQEQRPAPASPSAPASADDPVAATDAVARVAAARLGWSIERLGFSGSAETQAGASLGTPSYMSPEQAAGRLEAVDQRSDVWGLGAVLYEILTGQPPFGADTPEATVRQVLTQAVPPVRSRQPEAPPELAAVAEKALRKHPAERYQGAKEVADEVDAYLTGHRGRSPGHRSVDLARMLLSRHRVAAGAGALGLVVGLIALVVITLAYRREHVANQRARRSLDRALATREPDPGARFVHPLDDLWRLHPTPSPRLRRPEWHRGLSLEGFRLAAPRPLPAAVLPWTAP